MSKNLETLKNAALKIKRDGLGEFELKLGLNASMVALSGQLIRFFKDANHHYIFPQFLRFHLTNLADPIPLAGIISGYLMAKGVSQPKRVLVAAFAAVSMGAAWEGVQMMDNKNHAYDFEDTASYAAVAVCIICSQGGK